MTDQTRETFEAWNTTNMGGGLLGRLAGGGYVWPDTSLAWSAWQGATLVERERCALVCEAKSLEGITASEPEFWPDELRIKYMAVEISELRAAIAQPADCGNTPYDEGTFTIAQPVQPAAVGAVEQDSKRYLFLKAEAYEAVIPHGGTINGSRFAWITKLHPGANFDEAIDAALAAKGANK